MTPSRELLVMKNMSDIIWNQKESDRIKRIIKIQSHCGDNRECTLYICAYKS